MTIHELEQPHRPSSCPRCTWPTQSGRPFCERCHFDLHYGSVTRTLRGQCIYCEKRRAFSREHIFPKWLRKVYPQRSVQMRHTLRRPERHACWEPVPMHSHFDSRLGDAYAQVVLNVCEPCNNKWMSVLQSKVKPLLIELAEGRWPEFSDDQRAQLARWCAMVSINFECIARVLTTTQHQRSMLMNGSMPDGWKVSVGLMTDTTCAGDSFHRSVAVPIGVGDRDHIPLMSTYFCIERAAFYTLKSVSDQVLSYGLLGGGLSNMALPTSPVWPVNQPFDKLVGTGLTRDDLLALQRQFEPGH